jgi:hypothetical protein
MDYSLKRRK